MSADANLRRVDNMIIAMDKIEGFLTLSDIPFLQALAIGRSNILEIGSYKGLSAAIMLKANSRLRMTCIDPWDGPCAGYAINGTTMAEFESNLERIGVRDRVSVAQGMSKDVVPGLPECQFDATWIDGDHDENAVYSDMCGVWPKLKQGAAMTGHDAVPDSGAMRAVERFAALHRATASYAPGTNGIWFIKKA
tara:strand:- start:2641 stop:3219 length:579 start_codon:yes stop_codon:yes gene_type:complete